MSLNVNFLANKQRSYGYSFLWSQQQQESVGALATQSYGLDDSNMYPK
jgi:hypothetical protein